MTRLRNSRPGDPGQWRMMRWFAPASAAFIYLFLLFIGGALWWREYRSDDGFGQCLAALLIVGVISIAGSVICHVDKHRAPAPFLDPQTQSLVIPHSRWTGISRIALCTPLALYLAAATWQEPYLAILTIPVIAYLSGPAILRLTGRWRPGGLWLDAEGVTYRSPGTERSLAWSQVATAEPATRHSWLPEYWGFGRHTVQGIALRAAEGTTITNRSRLPLWRERPQPADAIFVRPETLAVPAYELERFFVTLVKRPKARHQLDSPDILKALEDPAAWRRRL